MNVPNWAEQLPVPVALRCANMAFLRADDQNLRLKIKEIDIDIQNKFSVRWFEEKSKDGVPFRCWLAKKEESGVAWCLRCFATLQYSSALAENMKVQEYLISGLYACLCLLSEYILN